MTPQSAILSGRFSVAILGRRPRLARNEDSYQGRHSSLTDIDLLNLESRQRVSPPDRQVLPGKEIHPIIEAQNFSQLLSPEGDGEESEYNVPESLSERINNRQGTPSSIKSDVQASRRAFPRPAASVLSEDSKRIIGENGLRRFEEFKRYHFGWDYGRGKPLSPRSITVINSFLEQFPELAAREPSLFLTHQGNLSLGWEDGHGNVVELEFFPDKIEYYIESLNEEGWVGLEALHQLIDKVRPTIL